MARKPVGILGGTGDRGRGLAGRLASAAIPVIIGSRQVSRATSVAAELGQIFANPSLFTGASNEQAATLAEIVIVAVPFDSHKAVLASVRAQLAGKIVVDCVSPLEFDARGPRPLLVPEGSAAEQAAQLLPGSRIVGAFHHVSAKVMLGRTNEVPTDVLVTGDDEEAKTAVMELADAIPGMRAIDAGPLRLSRPLEAMTAVLLAINRRYKGHAAVRLTDVSPRLMDKRRTWESVIPT